MTENTGARRRDIICILGMHRSGTSLLTRILNLIGLDLGAEEALTTEPAAFNPKGYWEHQQLTLISDAILKRFGGSWDKPPHFPHGWETSAALDDLRDAAERLLQTQFAEVPLWGWKDPRTCLTLPFWQRLLPEMRYIICLRNPLDVARSLEHRDRLSAETSFALWLNYVASALRDTVGKARLVIFYEDLMDDGLRELQRLAEFLGKLERAQQVEVQNTIAQFIEKNLQHHRTGTWLTPGSASVGLRAMALYQAQRIAVSFERNDISGRQELDEQIQNALDALSQYSTPGSRSPSLNVERLTMSERALEATSTRIDEKDEIVERLSRQVEQQAQAIHVQTEAVRALAAEILDAETQAQRIKETWGWRLLRRYVHLKQTYLSP